MGGLTGPTPTFCLNTALVGSWVSPLGLLHLRSVDPVDPVLPPLILDNGRKVTSPEAMPLDEME